MKKLPAFLSVLTAFTMLTANAGALPADDGPVLSAECAVVINADTNGIIYGKNEQKQHAMASTTKIMTALITLESGDLDRPFTVDSMAVRVEGTSMGLRERDTVTRRALCFGMLLPSGNDAANAAAVNIAGSLSAFAELMNRRAAQIGMTGTHFVTPSGLDADGHYTTAYDMALLTSEALRNKDFREICGLKSAKVEFGSPAAAHTLRNSNKMLSMYDGCIGVKTGFTDNAGRCLVTAAERNGCTVIAVTLHAPDDWNDHKELLDLGFSRVKPFTVQTEAFAVETAGGTSDTVPVSAGENPVLGLTADEADRLTVSYNMPAFVYAEVCKGDTIGYADVKLGDSLLKRVPLRADEDVERAEPVSGEFERLIRKITGALIIGQ